MSTDVRAALADLVALHDLKTRLSLSLEDAGIENYRNWNELSTAYERRKPLAWAAAREALATPAEPKNCCGVADPDCDYLAVCGQPCNKCGKTHRPHVMEACAREYLKERRALEARVLEAEDQASRKAWNG